MKRILFLILVFSVLQGVTQNLPYEFDLRDVDGQNYVTDVENQEAGTCWTFSTAAAMESNLLMTDIWNLSGEEGQPDLAEYHMDWWNGFNDYFNDDAGSPSGNGIALHQGGSYRMASAYLTRGTGAVRNEDGQSFENPPEQYNMEYHLFRPRHIVWLNAGEDLENINEIKQAIKNHGAIGSCIAYDEDFIDWQYNHYQPPESDEEPNHAVTIIGWNDRRITAAPMRGAWLCKNSWGPSWGNNGYFWVSYYDKYAGKHPTLGAVVFSDVRRPEFDNFYYHDYHGWVDTLQGAQSIMNHYVAGQSEFIKSISFVTAANEVDYYLRIYKSFENNQLSDMVYEHEGTVEYTGFHATDLNPVVQLQEGEDFYIYLRLSHGGYAYDRTHTPNVLLGEGSKELVPSDAKPDESYYRVNSNWKDFYDYDDPSGHMHSGNFCLKAYTMYNPPTGMKNRPQPSEINVTVSGKSLRISQISGNTRLEQLKIFSTDGRLVCTKKLGHSKNRNVLLTGLPTGIYIYTLNGNQGHLKSGKFMLR